MDQYDKSRSDFDKQLKLHRKTHESEITAEAIGNAVDAAIINLLPVFLKDRYNRNMSLMEMGLNSLELMELRSRLSEEFLIELSPTFFFQYSNAESAIQFLIEKKIEVFKEWLYEVQWIPSPLKENFSFTHGKLWVVLEEGTELSKHLCQKLIENHQHCICVKPGQQFKKISKDIYELNPNSSRDFAHLLEELGDLSELAGFIDLWKFDGEIKSTPSTGNIIEDIVEHELSYPQIDEELKKICSGLINLANALATSRAPKTSKLWVINTSIVFDGNTESLVQTPYNSLCKAVREEYPGSQCTHLALDPTLSVEANCNIICDEILSSTNEPQICWRNEKRLVARLVLSHVENYLRPNFSDQATYIVAGGLRPLGLQVAQWYINHGAKNIILLDELEPDPKIDAEINLLRVLGANVKAMISGFDDLFLMEKIFSKIKTEFPPIKGIIQTIGLIDQDLLIHLTWDRFRNINRLKIACSWHLHLLTKGLILDHFILFSTSLIDLAPGGRASYLVGNSFLDALSYYRKNLGFPSLTIDWGPWALSKTMIQHLTDTRLSLRVKTINHEEALLILDNIFYTQKPQIMAAQVEWESLLQLTHDKNVLFNEIAEKMKLTKAFTPSSANEPIAIIGMACRFPGAKNYRDFWDNLVNRVDSIVEIPSDRWDWKSIYGDPKLEPGKTNVKWGGFIEDIDKFDPLFFNISPKEAAYIDPQHRLFLQTVWHAMEDAGYSSDKIAGQKVGVYAGVSKNDYAELMREDHAEILPYISTGTVHSILTNRVSYILNLHGPSESIDTACSSALVALHSAVRDLRNKECDLAFVGGVNILISPTMYISHTRSGMLSEDGHCKTFDASANGYVRGEGVGVLLLKPFKQAVEDGDVIHAVIRDVAINHGGKATGLTAPSVDAEAEVVTNALTGAQVSPQTVTYVEVHGTGTPLGDPIEIDGLKKAYEKVKKENNTVLGAVKTNIGHLESASGIAGIIKMVLALKNHAIPANLHFKTLNPRIILEGSPFTLAKAYQEWNPVDSDNKPIIRRGGVSSFGMGGANGHAILEESTRLTPVSENIQERQIFPISARKGRLVTYVESILRYLEKENLIDLNSFAYTLQTGRNAFDERVVFLSSSFEDLKKQMSQFISGNFSTEKLPQPADDWMKGLELNWEKLWNIRPIRTGGIPGYPFQPLRCWYEKGIKANQNVDTGILNISTEEFFLRDHIVAGKSILPGVMYLEFARKASIGKTVASIHNVNWMAPIEASGNQIKIQVNIDNDSHFSIIEGGSVKCTGELIFEEVNIVPEKIDISKIIETCPHEILEKDIYKMMEINGLKQGPSLRVLKELYSGAKSAIGLLKLNPSEKLNDYLLHPSLMDGVFQTVVAHHFSEHADTKHQYLPYALESVTWYKPLEKEVYAYVEELQGSGVGNLLIYRMKMLNLNGEVLVQFEKFARRPIRQLAKPIMKDIYYIDRWKEAEGDKSRVVSKSLLLFSSNEALKEALAEKLPGVDIISVAAGSHFEKYGNEHYILDAAEPTHFHELLNDLKERDLIIKEIVWAWDLYDILPVFHFTQTLIKNRILDDLLFLYVYSSSSQLIDAQYAMAGGFARTLSFENPKIEIRSIELDPVGPEERASLIATELSNSSSSPLHEVSYTHGIRKVREVIQASNIEQYIPKKSPFKKEGNYLITGGAGGLGQIFAKYLADNYKANLILVGRTEINNEIKKVVEELKKSAASVSYLSADVTNVDSLQKAFQALPKNLQSLNGVIHAAGIKIDSFILKKKDESFNQVIAVKVKGALNLDTLTKHMKLDFMVLFSSIASLIPNQGQSDYAAANSFLDRFAYMRNKKREGITLAINWPLWASGGMQVTLEQEEHLKRVFGMDPLPTDIGIKAFEHLLGYAHENKVDQIIVISGDKSKILNAFGTILEDYDFPLIDSIEEKGGHPTLIKEFSANAPYINGFSIEGKPAVPGACFLEMARQGATKLYGNQEYVSVDHNFWPNPLMLKEGKVIARTMFTQSADHIDFEISSITSNNQEIVNATGILKIKQSLPKPKPINLHKKMKEAKEVIKTEDFYSTIHQNADLRLAGNFRPVQELHICEKEAIARLALPSRISKGKFIINPIIFTGLEQSLLVYTAVTHKKYHPAGLRLMPVSIEVVDIYAPFPESCLIHISPQKEPSASNKIQRFDATIYDDKGEIVAFVSGNTMRISPLEVVQKTFQEVKTTTFPDKSVNAENYIKKILSEVLGIKQEEIDSTSDFEKYGVTSQMIVELNTLMEKDLGPISKTLFFEYANVRELAGYIQDKLQPPLIEENKIEIIESVKEPLDTDIAIIGMSGRFPDASNLDQFWNNLVSGKNSVSQNPMHQDLYHSDLLEKNVFSCKWGGSISDIDAFDPEFFGIAPKEGALIDPQERLFLKVSWEALQDAGWTPKDMTHEQRKIGVFVGVIWQDYQLLAMEESLKADPVVVSSLLYSIANRVSYTFNFTGPSFSVDTACSSSLTALHLACQSLILGESKAAIVGGVNLNLHPMKYGFLNYYHFLSSEGKCRSYGEGGDGYVPGEGIGALVLKPYTQALKDGDPVYAIIKGSAINHGGKTRGFTVPNPALQSEVILSAIQKAHINPRDISYVEGHGTGTALGDPVEIRGLELAYTQYTPDKQYCAIGSVKSNIGHLEGAAGVASIIKVILQMEHKTLVPSLHSEIPNKNIDFSNTPFYVQRTLEPWNSNRPLLAAISSFGAGGSYAHVIIEEAITPKEFNKKRYHEQPFTEKEGKYWIKENEKSKTIRPQNIYDFFYDWSWEDFVMKDFKLPEQLGRWLILSDGKVSDYIVQLLESHGSTCKCISLSEQPKTKQGFIDLIKEFAPTAILHLSSTGQHHLVNRDSIDAAQKWGTQSLFNLFQAIISLEGQTKIAVVLVTQGAYSNNIINSPMNGLFKTAVLEHPEIDFKHIDLRTNWDPAIFLQLLYLKNGELIYSLDGKTCQIPRLVKSVNQLENKLQLQFNENATYLITGGLGGLGLTLCQWLIEKGARQVVLTGRRQMNDEINNILKTLLFQNEVKINYESIDMGDEKSVSNLLDRLQKLDKPLKGIFHLAGIVDDATLHEQTWDRFENVFSSKVYGSFYLHQYSKNLDFFVMFSSVVSTLGNPGQGNYAAANAFMDALCRYRKEQNLPALSISWGPWAEVGMAKELITKHTKEGLLPIYPKEGLQALEIAMHSSFSNITIANIDWKNYIDQMIEVPSWLSAFIRDKAKRSDLLGQLQEADMNQRLVMVKNYVAHVVKSVLGFEESKSIDEKKGFSDLGMDSLMALELKNRLQAGLGKSVILSSTAPFDHPTIEKMYLYISSLLDLEAIQKHKPERVIQSILPSEPIAIVGMACRYPGGSNSLEEFWHLLESGMDGVCEIPKERFDLTAYYDPSFDVQGKMYTRSGGFLNVPVDLFDAEFFGISPKEAQEMDPQQRLLLEVAWEAMEDALIPSRSLEGSHTGVYIGMTNGDYSQLIMDSEGTKGVGPYFASGNAISAASGRISFVFGLQGPCMSIDTACSSSLVAINAACEALRLGNCDQAIAGGVNLLLAPAPFIATCQAHMLSPDGHCKTFDKSADGYARAEGCGLLILKRLSDAERDNDKIYAVIRSIGVNQGGATSGLTVPNGEAQKTLIQQVYQQAGLKPDDIDFVETHGTGTSLGDPIEVGAIGSTYGKRDMNHPLYLGAVKSNVGHLESAAGVTSVIKTILSLYHQLLPQNLNFKELNPHIDLNFPAKILTEKTAWPRGERIRRAAVSSFGFSGINAHTIIEEAPRNELEKSKGVELPFHILTVSAKTARALEKLIKKYQYYLDKTNYELSDICYSTNIGRNHDRFRIAIFAKNIGELKEKLIQGDYLKGEVEKLYPYEFIFDGDWFKSMSILSEEYTKGAEVNWKKFHESYVRQKVSLPTYPFDRKSYWAIHPETVRKIFSEKNLVKLLEETTINERVNFIQAYLNDIVRHVLALSETYAIEPKQGFFKMGMDSLMALEVAKIIRKSVGERFIVKETVAFDYPSVSQLAEHLLQELGYQVTENKVDTVQEAVDNLSLDELLNQIEEEEND